MSQKCSRDIDPGSTSESESDDLNEVLCTSDSITESSNSTDGLVNVQSVSVQPVNVQLQAIFAQTGKFSSQLVSMNWQQETATAVFYEIGHKMDTDSALILCQDVLSCMGHNVGLASDITHLILTKQEEIRYKELFRAIVCRLYEERYAKPLDLVLPRL